MFKMAAKEISKEIKTLTEIDKGMNLIMKIIQKMNQANKIMEEIESNQISEAHANSSKE